MTESGASQGRYDKGSTLRQQLGAMGHKFASEVVASLLATGVITSATILYWHVTTVPVATVALLSVASLPPTPAERIVPVVSASAGPNLGPRSATPVPPSRPKTRLSSHTPMVKPEHTPIPAATTVASAVDAASLAPDISEPVFDTGVHGPALV